MVKQAAAQLPNKCRRSTRNHRSLFLVLVAYLTNETKLICVQRTDQIECMMSVVQARKRCLAAVHNNRDAEHTTCDRLLYSMPIYARRHLFVHLHHCLLATI
jgi:hypothetical protein